MKIAQSDGSSRVFFTCVVGRESVVSLPKYLQKFDGIYTEIDCVEH